MSSSSLTPRGTCRWMSPELFDPEKFGLKDSRRTIPSDCYALGMVIYEVLSGRVPFSRCGLYAVISKVSGGGRPKRPRGAEGVWFTGDIWSVLECCWKPNPGDRPNVADVLRCLGRVSKSWTPAPSQTPALAGPAAEQSTQDSDSSARGSADESEVSASPFHAALPQSHRVLSSQGDTEPIHILAFL